VVLDGRGEPRFIDFGLAWFRPAWGDADSAARPDGGTLRYLSPEQADPRLGPADLRTDVFGLGAVLYYLLTGRPLHEGAGSREVLRQAATAAYDAAALERAAVPKRLAAVCRKALAHDPQARFATAAELVEALTVAGRRPRWRVPAGLAGLFVAAVAGGWLLGQSSRYGLAPGTGAQQPALEVRVWRPDARYLRLADALLVRTGDELQVRLRVPPALHVGVFSVNGRGRLSLLRQYPPQDTAVEQVYPGPDQTRLLGSRTGTEALLVCGRAAGPGQ
jgi:hypothetical protein